MNDSITYRAAANMVAHSKKTTILDRDHERYGIGLDDLTADDSAAAVLLVIFCHKAT